MNDYVADIHRHLTELNRLEDEAASCRRSGRSALNSEALIESLRANISISLLLHHDRLRARNWQSVAEIRRGVCSACHRVLPIGTLAEVKRRTSLLRCDNCGRFVMLAEEELETIAPPVQGVKPADWRAAPK